jgi:dTDP-4-amino-4,6-dideoxygalactose transaminase/GNAT superfamily N-acetyltransferase
MISLYYTPDVHALPKFETMMQDWLKHPYIMALNCTNSAWLLLLFLFNISVTQTDDKQSCKIYCTPLTQLPLFIRYFYASRIHYIDIDPDTMGPDFSQLRSAIDANANLAQKHVIFIQHWNGVTINTRPYNELVSRDIVIIEDCTTIACTYDVSSCQNIQLINLGHKTHVCAEFPGEGTLMICPTESMYSQCQALLGSLLPVSIRMDDTSAYRASMQMEHTHYRLDIARLNAQRYDNHFSKFKYIQKIVPSQTTCAFPTYALRIVHPNITSQHLINFLLERKIQSSLIHYGATFDDKYVNMNELFAEIVMIPCGFWVDGNAFITITGAIDDWYKQSFSSVMPRLLEAGDYQRQLLELVRPLFPTSVANMTMAEFKGSLEMCINKFIYVIERDEMIVAHGVVYMDFAPYTHSPKIYIDYVIVHPDWRRRGLATALIHHMIHTHGSDNTPIYIPDHVSYPLGLLKKVGFQVDKPSIAFYSYSKK